MTAFVLVSIYVGVGVFVLGCVRRVLQYGRAPVHLRWELYPVPHEKPELVAHGGSYFEETDWWTRKHRRNLIGELRFMLPEMILLRGLWESNRALWFRSSPFHAGLYLMTTAAVLSVVGGAWTAASVLAVIAGLLAWAGVVLTFVGAVALFVRRVTDPKLRNYTTLGDVFNVGAFAAATALVLAGRLLSPTPSIRAFAHALITFDTSLHLPFVTACGLMIGASMAGYVPFTHMGHFVAKYFTYHAVRWDDAPMGGSGRKMAARVAEQLAYRPTWSASHIGADGVSTWAELATSVPSDKDEVRK